jgi:hypothetical protein
MTLACTNLTCSMAGGSKVHARFGYAGKGSGLRGPGKSTFESAGRARPRGVREMTG